MSMSNEKKKIYKPRPISGFPEWLPQVRRVEQQWFDHIRRVFESYGYCNIETPSVEELDAINAKGGDGGADADKEIYVIERLHKEEGDKEARLALHFDQTVPLARYTAQHFNELDFPFKRYQMQRVWRGERPQAGRFREFYQCDIDVINVDHLPLHFDAEMPAIIWEILSSLPGMENEKIQIQISNRKILIGYLESLGMTDLQLIQNFTRVIDKFGKKSGPIVPDDFKTALEGSNFNLNEIWPAINDYLNFLGLPLYKNNLDLSKAVSDWKSTNSKYVINAFNNQNFISGIEELSFILNSLEHIQGANIVANLMIVRGLDYYTGTVYETFFPDDPSYGSICSGGRYDDLAGNYINKHLPGVGISIGFSRLFSRLHAQNKLPLSGVSPAQFLITLEDESQRADMNAIAQNLRAQGYNVETYYAPAKMKKQLAYAEKKGIRYLWLLPFEERTSHEVKDMQERTQRATTIEEWKK